MRTSSAMVRVGISSKAALLVSLGALSWAMQYNGQQCLGAVDFELKDGSDVAQLDGLVSLYLLGVPGWVKQECMDAVRTNVCGIIYAPHAETATGGTTFCQSQCMDIAAACLDTAGLDPDLAALAPSQQCMGLSDDADCAQVGGLDESLLAEGECPKPLVVAKRHRFKEYEGKIVNVRGTACVVGCPIHRTFYGETYLNLLDQLYLWWAITGLIGAAAILSNIKPTGRRLYAWMFSSGSLCLNLLSVIFLASDYHEMLCDDGVGHRRRSLFMVGIGFGIHYCMLFSIIWICLQTVSMWKVIHGASPSKIAQWRKHFPYITIFAPLLICAAPLIGQNYGWSVMSMLPFPFMLVEDTKAYFWATFYAPILVLVLAQFLLGADAVYTFCRIVGRNYHCRSGGMTRRKFWNILRYNSEAIIFMVAIGLWTTICAGFVGYQTGHASFEFQDGMEEYVQCLLRHAYDGIDCPRSDFYDLSVKYTALEVVYISSFGIIALIAFSPSTRLWKAIFRPSAKNNSSTTDTEPSPTPRGSKAVEMKTFSAKATPTVTTKKHLAALSSGSSDEEDGATSSGVEYDSKHSSKDEYNSKGESREVGLEADSAQAV